MPVRLWPVSILDESSQHAVAAATGRRPKGLESIRCWRRLVLGRARRGLLGASPAAHLAISDAGFEQNRFDCVMKPRQIWLGSVETSFLLARKVFRRRSRIDGRHRDRQSTMQHGEWSCRIRVLPRTLPLLAAAAALLPPIASAWAFRAPHDLGSRGLLPRLSCPAHRQRNAQRRVSLQRLPVVAQDLRDGMDEERNAQVAALKKSFYAAAADASVSEAEADSKQHWSLLGVLEDIPLCRWEMVMLPGALEFSPVRPPPLPIACVPAGMRPMGWRLLPGAPWPRRTWQAAQCV